MNLTNYTTASRSAPVNSSAPVTAANGEAGQAGASVPDDAAPTVAGEAAPAALPAAQAGSAAPSMPGAGFGQWLVQAENLVANQADGSRAVDQPVDAAELPAQELSADVHIAEQNLQLASHSTPQQEPVTMLPAMAMPMLPTAQSAQATLAAVAAALPGAPLPVKAQSRAAVDGVDGAARPLASRSAPVDAGTAQADAQAVRAIEGEAEAAVVASAPQRHGAGAEQAAASARAQAPAVANPAFAAALGESRSAVEQSAPASGAAAAPAMGVPAQTAPATSSATVTLAGPPTAWRQSLQEALGERMHLQVGRNAEQAVIRLEPPMLGQVEIAIRHSGGMLEVHISATHHEVLRQLQAVSENLRSDLAQRQFTEVSVSVSAARASNGAAQSFAGEQQQRERQRDEQHSSAQDDAAPGLALAEAHLASAAFTLNRR